MAFHQVQDVVIFKKKTILCECTQCYLDGYGNDIQRVLNPINCQSCCNQRYFWFILRETEAAQSIRVFVLELVKTKVWA